MSERYEIRHETQGWIACLTWSRERADKWLAAFDPRMYDDKTLRSTDFAIVDTLATPVQERVAGKA
jgi:hypothetical protein